MSRSAPRSATLACVLGALAALLLFAHGAPARAEDPPTPEQVRERSLPLRTALHHDPTLGSPFDRLVELYRKADAVEDLLTIYRTHLQRYPQDGSARIVHVRLLLATNDPEAPRAVRDAVERHPDNGYLHYLLYTQLDDRGDPRALESLDKAITHETLPARKRRWVDMLLAQALKQDRRDLAAKHMATLAELLGGTAEARIKAARKMDAFGQHEQALAELDKARASKPSPETGVEIELLAAKLEVALGRREAAAERLDTLLGRLTADYWRRGDILRRRARLVASSEERDAMLAEARARVEQHPQDESAALDCARLLAGFERHREALGVLQAAGERLPASARIEQEILAGYDRLRDEPGRLRYLDARIERQPDRQDLVERRIRSLFLVGRKEAALEQLDALLAPLEEPVRIQRLLEGARFLRTAGLHRTAADLYERVVALAPGRLDVRREWAETHLADGDRHGARRVLSAAIPTDAPRDVFLDLMQLLTSQLLYPEARKALLARVEAHPDDLDVLLALVDVEGSLGYASSGSRWVDTARAHADTPARYRRWLEQSAAFHVYYDNELAFLDQEQERLQADQGAWNDRRVGRIEAFAEVCAEHDRVDAVSLALRDWLAGELPDPVRVRLRRKLAAMLEEAGRGWFSRNDAHLGEAADELRNLIRDDPDAAHAYRARLALIHIARRRPDLARPLLAQVEVRRLNQPRMLERLVRAYTDLDDGMQVLACLERLTAIQASERDHWEDWLAALTASGDERTLRSAIRRLLRGVPRMPLSQDTKDELEGHLADSYWRSIGAELSLAGEAGRLEALALLDEAERIHATEDMPLWVGWTRAWIQHRLGRTAARDEALGELDRLLAARVAREAAAIDAEVRESAEGEDPPRDAKELADERAERLAAMRRIVFPDGLSVAWAAARALLTAPGGESADTAGRMHDRTGPEGTLRVRWTFDTDGRTAIVAVLPLTEDTLLVADAAGDLHGVHRRTGKLLWHRPASYAARAIGGNQQFAHLAPTRPPVAGPNGTFFLPMPGRIACLGPDGQGRWEASLGAAGGQTTAVSLAADDEGVYVHDSSSGQVACFRHADGKLRWLQRLRMKPQSTPVAQGEGLSLADGRLLVYGPRTAILDAKTGAPLWRFEPDRARRMPLTLEEPEEGVRSLFGSRTRRARGGPRTQAATGPAAAAPGMPAPPMINPFSSGIRWSGRAPPSGWAPAPGWATPPPAFLTPQGRSPQAWSPKQGGRGSTAVVAPAVQWAAPLMAGEARLGLLVGTRMLLARNQPMAQGAPAQARALLLDTSFPMFASTERVDGTPVALHGPRLALLQQGRLVVWHLEQGTRTTFDLEPIADGRLLYRVETVQDGGFLYLAGPGGLLCVHLSTLKEVFRAAWPEAAKPTRSDDPNSLQHLLRGTIEFRNGTGWSPMVPAVGLCDAHALYVPSDPWRLVALEDAPDGR